MRWEDTEASKCRYAEHAAVLFGEADIIAENSVAECMGHANILAAMPDGRFAHCEWTFDREPSLDERERLRLTDEQIIAGLRRETAFFPTRADVRRYLTSEESVRGLAPPWFIDAFARWEAAHPELG